MRYKCPYCGSEDYEVIERDAYLQTDEVIYIEKCACHNEECNQSFEVNIPTTITYEEVIEL